MSCSLAGAGLWSGSPIEDLLPIAFLLLVAAAITWDVRERRIPNVLSLVLLVGGFAFSALQQPVLPGLLGALAGLGVGFGIWIGFYALGVMGAGDVKFFAAASAWLGAGLAWRASLVAALLGGLLSVLFLLRDGRLGRTLRRLALLPLTRTLPTAQVMDLDHAAARRNLPYGVALGMGAILAFLFPAAICRV
jgi:prepilin peptidase CpaA